jgi:hypothetical protein
MEKIAAAIIVAFAAFCVVWAFIKQLKSDDSGPCGGKCGGCPSNQKPKSNHSTDGDTPRCDGPKT